MYTLPKNSQLVWLDDLNIEICAPYQHYMVLNCNLLFLKHTSKNNFTTTILLYSPIQWWTHVNFVWTFILNELNITNLCLHENYLKHWILLDNYTNSYITEDMNLIDYQNAIATILKKSKKTHPQEIENQFLLTKSQLDEDQIKFDFEKRKQQMIWLTIQLEEQEDSYSSVDYIRERFNFYRLTVMTIDFNNTSPNRPY